VCRTASHRHRQEWRSSAKCVRQAQVRASYLPSALAASADDRRHLQYTHAACMCIGHCAERCRPGVYRPQLLHYCITNPTSYRRRSAAPPLRRLLARPPLGLRGAAFTFASTQVMFYLRGFASSAYCWPRLLTNCPLRLSRRKCHPPPAEAAGANLRAPKSCLFARLPPPRLTAGRCLVLVVLCDLQERVTAIDK
jgi:hypothetical protein